MQVRRLIIPILLIIITIVVSSCSVSRRTTSRYQTLSQRAQVTLQYNQHQYNMSSQVRVWRNHFIAVSVQPMLGIEMVRMEATPDSLWIFDKMNRKYVAFTYPEIEQTLNTNLSYKKIQDLLTRPTTKKQTPIHMEFTSGKHQLSVFCIFSHREQNTLQAPTRTKTNKYKQVTLREILPL